MRIFRPRKRNPTRKRHRYTFRLRLKSVYQRSVCHSYGYFLCRLGGGVLYGFTSETDLIKVIVLKLKGDFLCARFVCSEDYDRVSIKQLCKADSRRAAFIFALRNDRA